MTVENFFQEGAIPNFKAKTEAASCACYFEGTFLALKKTRVWPGYWCFPGGTMETGEPPEAAAARELREETGISIPQEKLLHPKKFFVRNSWGDYNIYLYLVLFSSKPEVILNEEHSEFSWLSAREQAKYRFIPGAENFFSIYNKVLHGTD